MVCIIDDREDVWSNASNLIHVKPYHFFQHTGDINAPPGLDKLENDNQAGVDLTKIIEKSVTVQLPQEKIEAKDDNDDKITEKKANVNGEKKAEDEEHQDEKPKQINIVDDEKLQKTDLENNKGTTNEENKEGKQTKEIESNVNGDNVASNENKSEKIQQPEKTPLEKDATKKTEESQTNLDSGQKSKDDNLIDIEDADDYLLHLEDILRRIHAAFYEVYDKMESGEVPDLKKVIPKVRSEVLKGCKLVFSGLVPTHVKLEQSKAYQIARSLGAKVTQDLEDNCTHLVAVRPGTAKVNAGRRKKNLKIVTPDWLWSCAERWERVNERIFPLNNKGSKNRHPPPHCSSPEHVTSYPEHNTPALRKRTPSGRFMDTINPLMSFSSADIADMDKEVEDILDDESDSSSSEDEAPVKVMEQVEKASSSSSEDSMTGEYPKGYKRKREESNLAHDLSSGVDDDEALSTKFRRGELVGSELDIEQDSQDSDGSVEAPDEVDDGEWNIMGAALEREFLSNN